MPDTNFDLAPPAADVDGLHAVPIDIQRHVDRPCSSWGTPTPSPRHRSAGCFTAALDRRERIQPSLRRGEA